MSPLLLALNLIKEEVPQQGPKGDVGHLKRYSLRHGAQIPLKSCPISSRVSHVTSTEEMVDLVQYTRSLLDVNYAGKSIYEGSEAVG